MLLLRVGGIIGTSELLLFLIYEAYLVKFVRSILENSGRKDTLGGSSLDKGESMFTFHRIGWINGAGKEVSSWNCLIETKDQLDAFMQWYAHDIAQVWVDIKNSPEGKPGHCRTTKANVMKQILDIKMTKEGKSQIGLVEGVNHIEHILTKTIIDIFIRDGSVYVNPKGGCRTVHIRDDDRFTEQIFETRTSKDLVFPTPQDEIDEVKITNWPLCPHFYLSVNGKNIEVDGVQKWKTISGAEEAKRKFERRRKAARRKK